MGSISFISFVCLLLFFDVLLLFLKLEYLGTGNTREHVKCLVIILCV